MIIEKVKMNINAKLILFVLSSCMVIFVIAIGYVSYVSHENAISDATKMADAIVREHARETESALNSDMSQVRAIAHAFKNYKDYSVEQRLAFYKNILRNIAEENPHILSVWTHWEYKTLDPRWQKNYGRVRFTYYRKGEQLLYKQDTVNMTGDNTAGLYYKVKTEKNETANNPYWYSYTGSDNDRFLETSLTVPILDQLDFVGLAGFDLAMDRYEQIVKKINPVDGSYAMLIANDGSIISHPNPKLAGKLFSEIYKNQNNQFLVMQQIAKGANFSYFHIDSVDRQNKYLSFAPITIGNTKTPWSMALVIPVNKIMEKANHAMWVSFGVALFGLILLALIINLISRKITTPVVKTIQVLKTLARGEIDKVNKLHFDTEDEIGEMAQSVNTLVDGLNSTAHFARQIGEGNLDAWFEKLSENDVLGKSLIDMRKNLKKAEEEESARKKEDEKNNWVTNGIAHFSDILRQHTDKLEDMAYNLMSHLVGYIHANQGALFILNDNDPNDIFYEIKAAIAFDRRKLLKKEVRPGEELVGRCAHEKMTIFMIDVPDDYVSISSGLGGSKPKCILLVPLKLNDQVYGVIELVSFKNFEPYQIQFVEKIGESIASSVSNAKVAIKTADLLQKAQLQGEELSSKEEEMRQSLEELQATQDEMERKNLEMIKLNEQFQKEKILMDNLMTHVPDAIYFKDLKSRFILASKSVISRFKLKTMDELANKSDFDFFTAEHARPAYEAEQEIIKTGKPIIDLVEKETRPDGTFSYVSTTKMPLRDTNNNIVGTFGISKDITQNKEMENALKNHNELLKQHEEEIGKKLGELLKIKETARYNLQEINNLFSVVEKTGYCLKISANGTIESIRGKYEEITGREPKLQIGEKIEEFENPVTLNKLAKGEILNRVKTITLKTKEKQINEFVLGVKTLENEDLQFYCLGFAK